MASCSGEKRKHFSLKEKQKILDEVDTGRKKTAIAKDFGIAPSTLSTIIRDREKIVRSLEMADVDPSRKKLRKPKFEEVDTATYKWFVQTRAQNIPVSGPLICEKAKSFASLLDITGFEASSGWLDKFRKRHDIHFKAITGEEAVADREVVREWRESVFKDKLQNYGADDVFNADETALFYKLLPGKTMAAKGDSCKGGKKSKQRITVLFCCNASGTEKCKPLVIGHSLKPRCFKNVKSLPADYNANRRAWMTAEIFAQWLLQFNKRMQVANRNVAMLVDNCSAHSRIPPLSNVTVFFLPPNCTSVLQPLDQGIRSAKSHYRKRLLQRILLNIQLKLEDPTAVDIRQAIEMATGGWWNVTPMVIKNCWRKAGFSFGEADSTDDTEEVSGQQDEVWAEYAEATCMSSLPITMGDYIAIDDNVATSAEMDDADIVREVMDNKIHETSDEEDDQESPAFSESATKLSLTSAVEMVETLQSVLLSLPNVEDSHFVALDKIRTLLTKNALTNMTQSKIDMYLTPK